MLVQAGMLTAEKLTQALAAQRERGGRLGEILVAEGFVSETQLTQTLSNQLSVPWVSLHHVDFTRALLNHVPRALAERYGLVPVYVRAARREGDTLFVAMDDPTHEDALAAVSAAAGLPVRPMVAAPSDIRRAIRAYYGGRSVLPAPIVTEAVAARPVAPVPVAPAAPAVAEPPPLAASPSPAAPVASTPAEPAAPIPTEAAPATPALPGESQSAAAAAPVTVAPAPAAPSVAAPPAASASSRPRMIAITLLDGTSIALPAPAERRPAEAGHDAVANAEEGLTAADLVAALRARASGADVSAVLGDATWESMFAALLSVLLQKRLVADWEFVEEWQKHRR
jgi:type IV pilus assembly protein PilB